MPPLRPSVAAVRYREAPSLLVFEVFCSAVRISIFALRLESLFMLWNACLYVCLDVFLLCSDLVLAVMRWGGTWSEDGIASENSGMRVGENRVTSNIEVTGTNKRLDAIVEAEAWAY
ncbi:Pentatricopeptide repeat-containing protein [Senna tora]|uniref:Pentatricopeptide repeat-containing protein n=1 Tax=Senna tora TaxID=362788 RepID=A0A834SVI2_9FABA|nr:Pentatricopeptide repeat-containing protein [Senna tora]